MIVALVASACATSPGARDAANGKAENFAYCQLVTAGRMNDGRRVRVRADFGAGADYVRLFDPACPSNSVFAKSVREDVDLTLCRSDELAAKFGCPVNGESGVKATFEGTYHYTSSTVGRLDVDEMSEISTSP